jgi:chitinase
VILLLSAALSAQTRDRTPPTAPTNLVVTATTSRSVSLAWGPSTDNSGRFSYIVCCAEKTVTVSQAVTSHTIDGLKSGATYTLRVYAKDAAGNLSKSSNVVTVTLPGDLAAPSKPVVSLVDVGPTHASLTWLSTDDGPTIWYTIYIDGQAVNTLNSRTGMFTPLEQETTYTFTVRARDVDGNLSPYSDPLFVTTEPPDPNDHTAPSVPANITAQADGPHINLQWDPATDDLTIPSLIRYDISVNGELRTRVVGSTSAQIESDYGVVNVISIVAVDAADNESQPGVITVRF